MSEELQEVKYYELMSYKDSKATIKANINDTVRSFVSIGYYLKRIRDKEMFTEDGYQSIWELAQAEFGISKPQASKFMSINDKFSKDGNSPILLDKYKDFSSSKLSEMLYLTDEQLEQVTVGTTVAQIREIKNPEPEVVSTSKQEEPELSDHDKWMIRCEVEKEMCNAICKMSSYILEKNDYSMETIKSLSRGQMEFSFGFGDDGTGHSKYDASYRAERYYVEEFNGIGKWIFEAGEIDQHIWNFNGREWHNNHSKANDQPEITNDTPESESEDDHCSRCKLNGNEDAGILECLPENGEHKCWIADKSDEVLKKQEDAETVESIEADIIQTVSESEEELADLSELEIAKELLSKKQDDLKNWIKLTEGNRNATDVRNINKLKVEIGALAAYICDLDNIVNPIPEPEQPELPILKNNDQRKEWAENYKAWGEWYHDVNIDCHYYKYDFPTGDRLIVDEYRDREVYWNAEKRDEQQYHLLRKEKKSYGGKNTYEEKYSHQTTSMSEIVEYLKEFQKKGA